MKKIISIVLGVAALAACTKTSVSYEQPGEIALAPVTRANMTKAAITGTTFPTTNDMGVYAFYNAGKLKDTQKGDFLAGSAAYLKDVKFVNRAGSGNWGGETSYYWPKTGSLVFAAYSPSVAKLAYDEQNDAFSATNYVQSADLSSTVDLLWSPMTAKSHDKTTAAVPMVFYHTMSWVTVQAVAANSDSDSQFKIKSVELNDIVNKGSFKTAGATITWTRSTLETDKQTLTVFSDNKYKTVELPTTEKPVQALENNAKGTVVIPQTLNNDVTLTVVFSQLMPTGAWSADQTLTFKLNECKTGDPAVALNEWENGMHYIYTLNFNIKGATGENEILIKPTLTDWENVTANGINAQ